MNLVTHAHARLPSLSAQSWLVRDVHIASGPRPTALLSKQDTQLHLSHPDLLIADPSTGLSNWYLFCTVSYHCLLVRSRLLPVGRLCVGLSLFCICRCTIARRTCGTLRTLVPVSVESFPTRSLSNYLLREVAASRPRTGRTHPLHRPCTWTQKPIYIALSVSYSKLFLLSTFSHHCSTRRQMKALYRT